MFPASTSSVVPHHMSPQPTFTLHPSFARSFPGLRTCDVIEYRGTSMATPVTAGAAAIARQYFRDGFYPSGRRSKNSYHPSGALMRAALIGGAFPMDGFTDWGMPLEPPPSSRQGHGRV